MIEKVLNWFEQLAAIPHGSGNTKAISDFCLAFAKERGLEAYQDDSNNIIIKKKGNRDSAPIMLQGHLDMVCECDPGMNFDFEKEAIKLVRDENWLTAEGTTLGGDDGIAVAMCLAILDADDLSHPDLEVVFTTDEETGMFGAHALDTSRLESRRLLNIDSENEGVLTVGCAGGARAEIKLPIRPQYIPNSVDSDNDCFRITVTGLIGGHSGVEIDKGRLNSNIIMGDFLLYLLENDFNVRLLSISGGKADNVIPSETQAVVFASYEGEVAVSTDVATLAAVYVEENRIDTDPDMVIAVEPASLPKSGGLTMMLGNSDTERVIEFLNAVPNGIMAMNVDIPGLVETSLNLGQVALDSENFTARFSVRSSVKKAKESLLERLDGIAKEYHGEMTSDGHYPAWEFVKDSAFRDDVVRVFKSLYNKDPVIEIIHAGLECGIFSERIPGLDAISIGPDLFDIHTPKERLDLHSAERTMNFVLKILETV
ncbi:MAG: aminoacyl-histidine dipeptidase [Clostridia bacterium]|nr:aminoacyl-histidine dipeptidase [Clostridia bacterium]